MVEGIQQEQVIYDAIGIYPEKGIKFRNPLREDNNPGAHFYMKKGRWRLSDYGSEKHNGMDCWDLYCEVHGCSFKEAISNYKKTKPIPYKRMYMEDVPCRITYDIIHWTEEALEYWGEYGITQEQLEHDGHSQVGFYKFNTKSSQDLYIEQTPTDICFALCCQDRVKIYRPLAEREEKWKSDTYKEQFWHLRLHDSPSDTAFIASGYKDARCVFNALKCDLYASCVSETVSYDSLIVLPVWKELRGYEMLYIGMDFDRAGHESMDVWARACEFYNIRYEILKRKELYKGEICIKDWGDVRKHIPECMTEEFILSTDFC